MLIIKLVTSIEDRKCICNGSYLGKDVGTVIRLESTRRLLNMLFKIRPSVPLMQNFIDSLAIFFSKTTRDMGENSIRK